MSHHLVACPNCSNKIGENEDVCPFCGYAVELPTTTESEAGPAQVGTAFWWQWVVASVVGWAVGGVCGWAVFWHTPFNEFLWREPLVNLILVWGVLPGVVTGIAQWLVLRRRVYQAGWWIPISIVAWTAGAQAYTLTGKGEVMTAVMVGAVAGMMAGLAQWLVLRQQVYQAGWWILISVVAWALNWPIWVWGERRVTLWAWNWAIRWISKTWGIAPSGLSPLTDPLLSVVMSLSMAGAVVGGITGAGLVWLLRHPKQYSEYGEYLS